MQIPGEATGNPIHLTDSSNLPCEIAVVVNSEQETREGYNLLIYPYLETTKTTNGITFTDNGDGTITANGTATAIAYFNLSKPTLKAGTYKVSGVPEGASMSTYLMKFGTEAYTTDNTFTATEEFTPAESYIRISSGVTVNNLVFKPMVISGTETKPYEPYGASPSPDYPSEIVTVGQNVNIFNILDYTATLKYTGEAQIFDSNNFRVVAKYSTDSNCMTMFRTIDLTNYAGKTLTIQAIVKSNTDTNKAFIVLRQNNYDYSGTKSNELYDESQNTTDGVITLKYKVVDTINDNNRYLFMGFYATRGNNCNTGDYVDYKVKMVEGTEVGGYSPYGQGSVEIKVDNGLETTDTNYQSYTKVLPIQKEFVKIGDVEDTFVKVDGKWYEKHDIPKYELTGNESFSRGTTRNGFYYFEATISDLAGNYGKINRILCNVAKEISASDMYEVTSQKDLIGTNSKNIRLMLSDINTVSELQAYLSEQYANETPATLYYLSTTPKLIECTEEQSEILNSFCTYKNMTNISVDGIGTLKVNYKKDLETIINNLSATSVAE